MTRLTSRSPLGAAVAAGVMAGVVALSGCQGATENGPLNPSASQTASSSSPSAAADLTRPGAARRAVKQLTAAAKGLKVIKVDLTRTTATLSALKDGKVVAWQWANGVVSPAESDIQYIQQATFDPAGYAFDNLATIFAQAAKISGSDSNQELQIVEYDQGRVLMTVTTRPESMPVFFRADGTAISRLDFPSAAAFTEAIRDTSTRSQRLLAMGWDASTGFWSDVATSSGVVTRTTRQAKVPAWTASRKADTTAATFRAADVDPAELASLVRSLPAKLGTPGVAVSFQIHRIDQMATPVISFDVGGQKVVTTLGGTDITDVVGG